MIFFKEYDCGVFCDGMHYTLWIINIHIHPLYTVHCTLYSVYYCVAVHYIVYTVHRILYNTHSTNDDIVSTFVFLFINHICFELNNNQTKLTVHTV